MQIVKNTMKIKWNGPGWYVLYPNGTREHIGSPEMSDRFADVVAESMDLRNPRLYIYHPDFESGTDPMIILQHIGRGSERIDQSARFDACLAYLIRELTSYKIGVRIHQTACWTFRAHLTFPSGWDLDMLISGIGDHPGQAIKDALKEAIRALDRNQKEMQA